MNRLLLIITLVFLSSCNSLNHSYRFKMVKAEGTTAQKSSSLKQDKQDIIVLQKIDFESEKTTQITATNTEITSENTVAQVETKTIATEDLIQKPTYFENDISLKVTEDDSLEIVNSALETERIAKKSMITGIVALALYVLIPVLGIIGFIIAFGGLRKAKLAQSREYSTINGVKFARTGRILNTIVIVLGLVGLLLLLILLIGLLLFL